MTENKPTDPEWTSDDKDVSKVVFSGEEYTDIEDIMDPARVSIQMLTGKDIVGELRRGYWFVNKDTDS